MQRRSNNIDVFKEHPTMLLRQEKYAKLEEISFLNVALEFYFLLIGMLHDKSDLSFLRY